MKRIISILAIIILAVGAFGFVGTAYARRAEATTKTLTPDMLPKGQYTHVSCKIREDSVSFNSVWCNAGDGYNYYYFLGVEIDPLKGTFSTQEELGATIARKILKNKQLDIYYISSIKSIDHKSYKEPKRPIKEAFVWAGKTLLNEKLISFGGAGYDKTTTPYAFRSQFSEAQKLAKKQKKGLWRLKLKENTKKDGALLASKAKKCVGQIVTTTLDCARSYATIEMSKKGIKSNATYNMDTKAKQGYAKKISGKKLRPGDIIYTSGGYGNYAIYVGGNKAVYSVARKVKIANYKTIPSKGFYRFLKLQ